MLLHTRIILILFLLSVVLASVKTTSIPTDSPSSLISLKHGPVSQPVAKPSCQPSLPICQYGGYCNKDSDCYAGNYCRMDQLPYYSQCLPKPSTYKTSNCLANYYGNNQPCSSDNDCCDPGAFCNNLLFKQCQQPAIGSQLCSNPSKFKDNIECTIKPTTKPTIKQSPRLVATSLYHSLSRSLLANMSCRFVSMEDIVERMVIAMLETTAEWINYRTIHNAFQNLLPYTPPHVLAKN